jgi:AraC-like DNA-binding protein
MARRSPNIQRKLGPFISGLPPLLDGELISIRTPTSLASHRHRCWEITYLRKGEVTWELSNGLRLNVHGGQIALTQPRLLHRGELERIRPCELFWILVDPAPGSALDFRIFKHPELATVKRILLTAGNIVVNVEGTCGHLYDRLKHLLDQKVKTSDTALHNARIRICIVDLFLGLMRSFAVRAGQGRSQAMHAAVQQLSQNLEDKNAIDKAVQFSGLKRSRFFERFKNEVGLSPHEFVLRKRCELAQTRLHTDTVSITTVALDLGFYSSQHFAACFKKVVGMTPSAFRALRVKTNVTLNKI